MIHFIHQALPWVLSALTLWGVYEIGHRKRFGWQIGLVANSLWIVFDVWWAAWGLIPLSAALIVLYTWSLWQRPLKRLVGLPRKVSCELCGGKHVPNGIAPACVPYDHW